jgi:hypothetical protein
MFGSGTPIRGTDERPKDGRGDSEFTNSSDPIGGPKSLKVRRRNQHCAKGLAQGSARLHAAPPRSWMPFWARLDLTLPYLPATPSNLYRRCSPFDQSPCIDRYAGRFRIGREICFSFKILELLKKTDTNEKSVRAVIRARLRDCLRRLAQRQKLREADRAAKLPGKRELSRRYLVEARVSPATAVAKTTRTERPPHSGTKELKRWTDGIPKRSSFRHGIPP